MPKIGRGQGGSASITFEPGFHALVATSCVEKHRDRYENHTAYIALLHQLLWDHSEVEDGHDIRQRLSVLGC